MKLSTYTLKKSNKELIGLLKKDSLINLNIFFGEISLLELIQLPDWKELIIKKMSEVTNGFDRYNRTQLDRSIFVSTITLPHQIVR